MALLGTVSGAAALHWGLTAAEPAPLARQESEIGPEPPPRLGAGIPPPALQARFAPVAWPRLSLPELLPPSPPWVGGRGLLIPVHGVRRAQLSDSFDDPRGPYRRHRAIDIMAPTGTPVYAVDDGVIKRLFWDDSAGNAIYQYGAQRRYCHFYAHLERYADGLEEGRRVRRGDLLGYVGTTGNAPATAPHLHFAILELVDPARPHSGAPINPYRVFAAARQTASD